MWLEQTFPALLRYLSILNAFSFLGVGGNWSLARQTVMNVKVKVQRF